MLRKINWRYAIGEIIIVIIGISIAFGLNRWASGNKDRKLRTTYLESMLKDLDAETLHLRENIASFERKVQDIAAIRPHLYRKMPGRDTTAQKLFRLAQIVNFLPNDITYKTLVNSGHVNLLDDINLQKEIEAHYSNHPIIQLDYERQNKIHEKYFGDFIMYHVDYDAIYSKNEYAFFDKKELRNIINALYGTYNIAIKTSKSGIEQTEALKKSLQEAL
ncbi:MAG: DUF6090 family protein [Bacteroidota bacterium]